MQRHFCRFAIFWSAPLKMDVAFFLTGTAHDGSSRERLRAVGNLPLIIPLSLYRAATSLIASI
jgi:hypothetical protein